MAQWHNLTKIGQNLTTKNFLLEFSDISWHELGERNVDTSFDTFNTIMRSTPSYSEIDSKTTKFKVPCALDN